MSSPLLMERRGPVALLTLNRPERRNALTGELLAALLATIQTPEAGVAVMVLTGAGEVFCAGGDLGGPGMGGEDAGMLAAHRGRGDFAVLLAALARTRVPVIAAVNGDALGGGLGLAAASTLIVADEHARFGAPELKLGLFPWMISPVLSRALPGKVWMDLVLTGRRLSAAEGLALGFVARLAPPGEVVQRALALAEIVAGWSPAVVGLGMEGLAAVADLPLQAALAHMAASLSINLMMEDAGEGISAFLGRRPAEWKGR